MMLRSVEAVVERNGDVKLREPLRLSGRRRAIVTLLDEPEVSETALMSEEALGEDWNRPEEDEAWAHLRPAQ